MKLEQKLNKMRKGMSSWQQISRRRYHYHREPENEPDPLFIYYSTHLKGNKQLSASAMEFVYWGPSTCSGAQSECAFVSRRQNCQETFSFMWNCANYLHRPPWSHGKGDKSANAPAPCAHQGSLQPCLMFIFLICYGQQKVQGRKQRWMTPFPQIDFTFAFRSAPFTLASSSNVHGCK